MLKHPLQFLFYLIPVFITRIIIFGATFPDSLCVLGLLSYCCIFRHYNKKKDLADVSKKLDLVEGKLDSFRSQVDAVRIASGFRKQI